MSGEITPERLDALLDGTAQAETDAERALLALASRVKSEAPHAGAALRGRVRAIAAEPAGARRRPRLRERWALVAAPAVAAIAAAVIAVGVFSGDDPNVASSDATTVQSLESQAQTSTTQGLREDAAGTDTAAKSGALDAAPSVQAPAAGAAQAGGDASSPVLRVAAGTLDARLADIRRIVSDAGGTTDVTPTPGANGWDLTITLPVDAAPATLTTIAAFAAGSPPPIAIDPAGVALLQLTE